MQFILLVIVGAAAGFIATRLMRVEADIPTTLLVGILGAIIGGLILRFAASVLGLMGGFVGAVLGALVLVWVWQTYLKRK
jgi:uncharacterized membrane protein YeaQ/YmgE (transglycosylase-associated protein family)